jgi:hypothetical protein
VVTPAFGAEATAYDRPEDDDQVDVVAELDVSDDSESTDDIAADEATADEPADEATTDEPADEVGEETGAAAVASFTAPWRTEPSVEQPAARAEEQAAEPEQETEPASVAAFQEPAPAEAPAASAVPLAPVALAGAQASAVSSESPAVNDQPVRLTIRRPLSAAPAASALEGELVPDSNEPLETPIFGQLRSNWLNDEPERPWTSNEVERGWEAATEAETANADGRTRTGLPVRRPGGRLVPGGVAPEPAAVARDPEAIRNRLAAHSAGVSRGRAAAAAQPLTDDYAHEETGPA